MVVACSSQLRLCQLDQLGSLVAGSAWQRPVWHILHRASCSLCRPWQSATKCSNSVARLSLHISLDVHNMQCRNCGSCSDLPSAT